MDFKKELRKLEKETTAKPMTSTNFIKFMLLALELYKIGKRAEDIKLEDGSCLKV